MRHPTDVFSDNLQALQTLKRIRLDHSSPTQDDKQRLLAYQGWSDREVLYLGFNYGYEPNRALREVLDREEAIASRDVAEWQPRACSGSTIERMWTLAEKLCGNLNDTITIDPCAGFGQFVRGQMYAASSDPVSREIAKLLDIELNDERILLPGRFDLAIGAAPVGDRRTADVPSHVSNRGGDHWYLAKVANLLRPGGVAVALTSKQLLEEYGADSRRWVSARCEVLAIYELENDYIVILRKRPRTVDAEESVFADMPSVLVVDDLEKVPAGALLREQVAPKRNLPQYKPKNINEIAAVAAYKAAREALNLEIAGEPFEEALARAKARFEQLRLKIGRIEGLTGMAGTREYRLLEALQRHPALLDGRALRQALPPTEDKREYFTEPFTNRNVPLDEYLAGNVQAKLLEAEVVGFQRNIDALKTVLPARLKPEEIRVPLGAPWVPEEVMRDFALNIAGVSSGVTVNRIPCGGGWVVKPYNSRVEYSNANLNTWGVPGMTGLDLLEKILNLRVPEVFKKNEDGKRVIDEDATAQAQGKAEEIREEWRRWLKADETAYGRIADEYNRLFRGLVPRKYEALEDFPGLSLSVHPRQHQAVAAQRMSHSKADLVVHHVGYGKSMTALLGMVRRIQLGLVDRGFIVVPKSVLNQWRRFIDDYFPTYADDTLVAPEEFRSERKEFLGRIAAGEVAIIICTYEQFLSIPISRESLSEWTDWDLEPVRALFEAYPDDDVISKLYGKWVERADKAHEANSKRWTKDPLAMSWDTLVGDKSRVALIFDEWQYLKKIPVATKMTRVYGLPKDDSLRAIDALAKVHGIILAGGRVGGLTGTPITNSLAEAYVAMRFFQPLRLRELGLVTFDDWAATFTEPIISVEMDAVGQFRPITRLRFVNLPELVMLLSEVWSFASQSLEIQRPDLIGGATKIIEIEGSSDLQEYVEDLAARAELIRARQVHPSEDNMLKVTSDGRKASMWNGPPEDVFPQPPKRAPKALKANRFRGFKKVENRRQEFQVDLKKRVTRIFKQRIDEIFVTPELPKEEKRPRRWTKVDACAERVWELYHKHHDDRAVQLVFCDLGTPKGEAEDDATDAERFALEGVYGELRQRLVDHGMLESQIQFIHQHKSEAARNELFRLVNDGHVRVLIGSTDKLGVGTNPQRRVLAIHHLDCPWRPDQLIQRTGRGRRDGNLWTAMYEFAYVTTRSYDVCLWQLIQIKADFISRLQEGDVSRQDADDVGDLVLTAAMAKGLALGDQRVVDKIKLETQLTHLERQRVSWVHQRAKIVLDLDALPAKIEAMKRDLAAVETADDLKQRPNTFSVNLKVIGGPEVHEVTDRDVADSTVYVLATNLRPVIVKKAVKIGSYRGRELRLQVLYGAPALQLVIKDDSVVQILNIHNKGTFDILDRELGMLEVKATSLRKTIELEEKRFADLRAESTRPWGQESVAKEALTRYDVLCESLKQKGIVDRREFRF